MGSSPNDLTIDGHDAPGWMYGPTPCRPHTARTHAATMSICVAHHTGCLTLDRYATLVVSKPCGSVHGRLQPDELEPTDWPDDESVSSLAPAPHTPDHHHLSSGKGAGQIDEGDLAASCTRDEHRKFLKKVLAEVHRRKRGGPSLRGTRAPNRPRQECNLDSDRTMRARARLGRDQKLLDLERLSS